MKKIACFGTEAFTLGFQLAGIRKTVNLDDKKNILDQIESLKGNKEIGIVIIDEKILERLDSQDRSDVEDSVDPVFISLSTETSSDNIRKLIIKSIGVDLWKGD
ncbi:MAG: V-type ATP synthase subunit F [Candidatus Woesearchaeota archaeon]